jgi:predicted TIM-barrel fold metal-dependent hydrolase
MTNGGSSGSSGPGSGRPTITDAQVHVWADPTPERPWPESGIPPQRVPALGAAELLTRMDAAGVARAVLVPPTWEGPRNDLALAAAAAHPARFAVMGRLDPADPAVVAGLAEWRETPGLLGVRLSLNRGDIAGRVQAAIESGFFAEAERLGLPLYLYMPGQHALIDEIAGRFPSLRITVDHLALERADGPLPVAVAPLLPLARHANVAVKASALPCFVTEPFPYPQIVETVYMLVAAFGADRVFWGSDLSRLPCSYDRLVALFVERMPELAPTELAQIMGEGVSAWLNWPLAA